MSPVLDDTGLEQFTCEDFESAWQRDVASPRHISVRPQTTITIGRHGADDFQDRQIYVWIDGEALGKIRYGQSISQPVEPGRHTVRVFNTLFSQTRTVDAAPGEDIRLQCGNGMPAAGWLMMVFLHVTYLRVWLEPERA